MGERESVNMSKENPEKNLGDFLEEVFHLDQSTSDRTNAIECLHRLRARESEFISSSYEEDYWHAVSFELFHIAQNAALTLDNESAISDLLVCLEAAEKSDDKEWLFYVKGTLAYLEGNISVLKECMQNAGSNAAVLERLENGLQSRGEPSYFDDYNK